MAEPVLTVEVAFSTNPGAGTTTFTDVSAYVRGVSINRGRENELAEVSAGTCSIRLDNRDGRFDPSSTGGPYGANLLPMRKVKVTAVHDAVTYDLFHGFIERFEQSWPGTKDAVTTLECVDGFKILNLEPSAAFPEYPEEVDRLLEPWGYWRLNTQPATRIQPGAVIKTGRRKGKRKKGKKLRFQVGQSGPEARIFGSPTFEVSHDPGVVDSPWYAGPVNGEMTYGMRFIAGSRAEIEAGGPDRPGAENAITISCLFNIVTGAAWTGTTLIRGPKTLPSGPYAWKVTFPEVTGTRRLRFTAEMTSGANVELTTAAISTFVAEGHWQQLFCTWRGDTGVAQLFTNGVRRASASPGAATLRRGTAATSNPIVIGEDGAGNSLTNVRVAEVVVSETKWDDDADLAAPFTLYVNERGGGFGSPATVITAGQRMRNFAKYNVQYVAEGGFAYYNTTSRRDIDLDGVDVLPQRFDGDSKLDMMRRVEETDDGILFVGKNEKLTYRSSDWRTGAGATVQAEFNDEPTGTELPYASMETSYGDEFIYNHVTVTREGGDPQTAEDATSKTTFLERRYELSDTLHVSDADALALAETLLDRYKDKVARVTSLDLDGMMNDDLYPQILGRELFDRINVIRHTPGGNTIDADCRIHGIQLEISPKRWLCRWALAPESF